MSRLMRKKRGLPANATTKTLNAISYAKRYPDYYARQRLASGTGLSTSAFPASLVAAKRTHIQLMRRIRQYRKEIQV